jgi:N-acetylglucosamine kinase-like BadF-type ATPase
LVLSNDLYLCARTLGDNACSRDTLAGHARVVVDAARAGDSAARDILDHAGRELAAIADAVRTALDFPESVAVPVSWSGGAFNAGDALLRPFKDALHATCPAFELRAPLYPPHIGAALYAEKLLEL